MKDTYIVIKSTQLQKENFILQTQKLANIKKIIIAIITDLNSRKIIALMDNPSSFVLRRITWARMTVSTDKVDW